MELLSWRRQKVYDLLVAGYNQTEIADILKVSDHTVISRDVSHIRAQAKERIKTHLEERLPMEVDFCLSGVCNITKAALKIAKETANEKVKLAALALANDSYKYRMEIVFYIFFYVCFLLQFGIIITDNYLYMLLYLYK